MSADRTYSCLLELRDELRRGFPLVVRSRLRAILRAYDLHDYPDALMVGGSPGRGLVSSALAVVRRSAPARAARRAHPLFSEAFYRTAYPDVAGSRVDPWLHFQVLGRNEGRSPHPFVDPARLASQMPGETAGTALDRYLTFPENWLLSPGPHIDAESFVISGPWDGRSNPLVHILRRYPVDPWVRLRLGLIDLGTSPEPVQLAIGLLSLRHPGLAAVASFTTWSRSTSEAVEIADDDTEREFRVVPGFFLGAHGRELAASGRSAQSDDATVLRTSETVIALDAGERHACDRLSYVADDIGDDVLGDLAGTLTSRDLVAPATADQAAKLSAFGAVVLPIGRQAFVRARTFDVVRDESGAA